MSIYSDRTKMQLIDIGLMVGGALVRKLGVPQEQADGGMSLAEGIQRLIDAIPAEPGIDLRPLIERKLFEWRTYKDMPMRSFNASDEKPQRWVDAENRLMEAFIRDLEALSAALACKEEA